MDKTGRVGERRSRFWLSVGMPVASNDDVPGRSLWGEQSDTAGELSNTTPT